MKIKERLAETLSKVKDQAQKFVDENSENITEILIISAGVIAMATMSSSIIGKIVPSRTNLHVYLHMR